MSYVWFKLSCIRSVALREDRQVNGLQTSIVESWDVVDSSHASGRPDLALTYIEKTLDWDQRQGGTPQGQ